MRLIDADKLPVFDITDNIAGENGAKAIVTHWIQLDFITHAPTVKAIPIEWIDEWGWKNGMSESMSLRVMIDDWEKENGKD